MFEDAQFLHEIERERFDRFRLFILGHTSDPQNFSIHPFPSRLSHSRFHVVYCDFKEVGELDASLAIRTADALVEAQTSLFRAQMTLSLIAADRQFRHTVDALPVQDAVGSLGALGLDPGHLKPDVGPWAEGYWLAPEKDGYAAFYVDSNGSLSIVARSGTAVGAAVILAAAIRAEQLDIAGKVAAFSDH